MKILKKLIKTCFILTSLILVVSGVSACLKKPPAPPAPPTNSATAFKQRYGAELTNTVLSTPSSVFKNQQALPVTNQSVTQGMLFLLNSSFGIQGFLASAQTSKIQISFAAVAPLSNNTTADQPVTIRFTDDEGNISSVAMKFKAPRYYRNITAFNSFFIGQFSRIQPISLNLSQELLRNNLINAQNIELTNLMFQKAEATNDNWKKYSSLVKTAFEITNPPAPNYHLTAAGSQQLSNIRLQSRNIFRAIAVSTNDQGYNPARYLATTNFGTPLQINLSETAISSASLSTPATKTMILTQINNQIKTKLNQIQSQYSQFATFTATNNTLSGGQLQLSTAPASLTAQYTFSFQYINQPNPTPAYTYQLDLTVNYVVQKIVTTITQLSNQLSGNKLTLFKLNNNLLAWSKSGIAIKKNNTFEIVPFQNLANAEVIDLKTNVDGRSAYAIVSGTLIGTQRIYVIVRVFDNNGQISYRLLKSSFGLTNPLLHLFMISQDYFFITGANGLVYEINEVNQQQIKITGFSDQVNITNIVGTSQQTLFFTANRGLFSLNAVTTSVSQVTIAGITAQTKFNDSQLIQTFQGNRFLNVIFIGFNNGFATIWRWTDNPTTPLRFTSYNGLPSDTDVVKSLFINLDLSLMVVNIEQITGNNIYFANLNDRAEQLSPITNSSANFKSLTIQTFPNDQNFLLALTDNKSIILWKIQALLQSFIFTNQVLTGLTPNQNITTARVFMATGAVANNWQLVFTQNQKLVRYSSTWQQTISLQNITGTAQSLYQFSNLAGYWLQARASANQINFYNISFP